MVQRSLRTPKNHSKKYSRLKSHELVEQLLQEDGLRRSFGLSNIIICCHILHLWKHIPCRLSKLAWIREYKNYKPAKYIARITHFRMTNSTGNTNRWHITPLQLICTPISWTGARCMQRNAINHVSIKDTHTMGSTGNPPIDQPTSQPSKRTYELFKSTFVAIQRKILLHAICVPLNHSPAANKQCCE